MTSCPSCKPLIASPGLLYAFLFICLATCLPGVSAFGSGKIPDAAYLKGKAWRHGDIDDVLEGLVKVAGQGGGAIIGAIASAFFSGGSGEGRGKRIGGKKFSGLDVKRVYFGNWLRDLSQVCDIAGFKAMTDTSLVLCVMTMGFLTFGYATREFQVTRDRLAVYLLTEHIDNPKGYGEGEDPQSYDPRLRPRVDEDRELQIDERNGMKKYIASDDEDFDTSTKCIRRTFRKCIQIGREARSENDEVKEHESFRLLGTGLHTLEDFSAHSNWCELALQKLGHQQVFAHVGENVKVNSPDGPVPPLVTGTFAGADFCFSMLGEASDKLSSASIGDLTAQLDDAQNQNHQAGGGRFDFIKSILSKLPIGGGDKSVDDDLADIKQQKKALDLDGQIDKIAPAELQQKLWDLFVTRDNLMRRIEELIEGVPGLAELLESLSVALTQWIMITIDPYVRPILLQASTAIGQGSQAVISGNDQWTVFSDPNASDPTHSVLAKDHFSNILNDPAGNISVIIVKYTVNLIVDAWSNEEDADRIIDQILEAIHHPSFADRNSQIQKMMMDYMKEWLQEMDADDREITLNSLTKDSIREHRNQRRTTEDGPDPRLSGGRPSHGHQPSSIQQSQSSYNPQESNQYGRQDNKYNTQQQSGHNFQSGYGTSYPAKTSEYGQNAYGESDAYSEISQGARQDVYQGNRQGEQYSGSENQSEYADNRQDSWFKSSATYRPSDGQDYGGAGRKQGYGGQSGDYGGGYQSQARVNEGSEREESYRPSGRHDHLSPFGNDYPSSNQENSTSYNEPAQTTTLFNGRPRDDANAYGYDKPRSQRHDDETDRYGCRQQDESEFNAYRQSGQDDRYAEGYTASASLPRDGSDEYGNRTSAYASMPSKSHGGNCEEYGQSSDEYISGSRRQHDQYTDSQGRDRASRYVDSRHDRHHSTDSNSSKDSHKKHHQKPKHKHKSKSKSHSRDRDDRRRHGQRVDDDDFQPDSDYGMGRLNMDNVRGRYE
ncbi:hypothetical protein CROQUDRAFT_659517 [Cronartium quercuum f. sp. fusiforme G11]|uniref:Het-C-domain-containing protein n=1 Tax=Cronartium quercuum f. sp. fusiforme G11 TaxID=708437 RepID=A0A9P6NIJ8_9BASI|nr:hypothetical protein CROQUDRAFT_659517 [Cronartium quercuum f. sp. fusiforme G11]